VSTYLTIGQALTHAKGTSNILANVLAIKVLPVPVGPLQR
jgi:hypothetical protein